MTSDQEAKKLFFKIFFEYFETIKFILSDNDHMGFFFRAAKEKDNGIKFHYNEKLTLTYGNVSYEFEENYMVCESGTINFDQYKDCIKTVEYEICCDFILHQVSIFNETRNILHELYSTTNKNYTDLIQILITEFRKVGFLVPSPWHGDITTAKIIFVGPNPNIDTKCLYPRFHIDGDKTKITLAGEHGSNIEFKCNDSEICKKCLICNGCNLYDFHLCERYSNILVDIETEKILKQEIDEGQQNKIYKFFVNRIRSVCDDASKIGTLIYNINRKEYKIKNQPFWTGIVNDAKILNIKHNSILSTEIIPFGSKNKFGVKDNYIKHCQDTLFDILKLCNARIIILEGKESMVSFSSFHESAKEICDICNREEEGDMTLFSIKEEDKNPISNILNSGKVCKVKFSCIDGYYYIVAVTHIHYRKENEKKFNSLNSFLESTSILKTLANIPEVKELLQ